MKHKNNVRSILLFIICSMSIFYTGCEKTSKENKQIENTMTEQKENKLVNETDFDKASLSKEDKVLNDSAEVLQDTEEQLNETQKNSIAMLNYLATLSQEINSSKNSRMFLEEAYAALINNTNPEKVNELTESHLSSLLDIIEKYRIISVKRDRLQYIYDQNKAMAIKESIPDPVGVLSAASSLDMKRLVGSVVYMAVDSYESYKSYNKELDNEFLQEGWELDDEEAENLHDSRKRAFMFMIDIVRDEKIPGELALNENAVEDFVLWKNNENVHQRLQFLESEENVYKAFGNYWLELAECYYEKENYNKCLISIEKYEELQSDIFRKDYYLAEKMPKAIVSAAEVYTGSEYISEVEKFLNILIDNTETSDWSLRYFAAQVYIDLYTKTNDEQYMEKAYNVVLNNVNVLIDKQEELNDVYISDVKEIDVPDGATKKEKKQIKKYNKSLKKQRKTELPTVYEPLVLNCDLLFALANKMDISDDEKIKIEGILEDVFLNVTYEIRYSFNEEIKLPDVTYKKSEIVIPACMITETSIIKVLVAEDGEEKIYDDWKVEKVERDSNEVDSFKVYLKSKKAKKQTWSKETEVKIEIYDGDNYEPTVVNYNVSNYKEGFLMFPDKVEFEQVK